jgi:hypothetical protein
MGEDRTNPPFAQTGPERQRYTVAEAARILNTTAEAIRSRLKRGTLDGVKEGTTVYVLLSPDQTPSGHRSDTAQTADPALSQSNLLISEMRSRVEDLRAQLEAERRANEQNTRIIAALTSRLPELPAAQERPRQSPPGQPAAAEEGDRERSRRGPGELEARAGRPSWSLVVALVSLLVLSFATLGFFGVLLFAG